MVVIYDKFILYAKIAPTQAKNSIHLKLYFQGT